MVNKSKETIISDFKINDKDTGSTAVQVALLTDRIVSLGDHFKKFAKDATSRLGLTKMVAKRRKLLDYLERTNSEEYKAIIKKLGIRR